MQQMHAMRAYNTRLITESSGSIPLDTKLGNTTKATIHQVHGDAKTQNFNTKKLQPGLVASYDLRPGNEQGPVPCDHE